MYDITKTRMLLTTAVLAAVAVVFASGANARAATPVAIQECSVVQADVVSRYLDINRTSTSQKRVARPRPNKYPDGRRSSP